ncbi:somatostatin receptor type 5-like [Littorina saxatilis]|uniref:somatostatin receptor type 5-like n=1 Tax=Littorina saxatilis TaxID=31220 RepID=UPI0038B45CF3
MNTSAENTTSDVFQNTTKQNSSFWPMGYTDPSSLPLMHARLMLRLVVIPIIICLALFGNSMTVAIIYRLKAKRSTVDQYLIVIAVADTLFILTSELNIWVYLVTGVSLVSSNNVMCKLTQWLIAVTSVSSVWLLVAMTTQRALSVVWPHRINVMCTSMTSWRVIAGVVVTSALTYAHALYGIGVNEAEDNGCTIVSPAYFVFAMEVWTYVDLCLNPFLPFACILIANVVLVVKLRESLKHATEQLGAGDSQHANRSSEALSVSVTVITVSLSFIVLTAPAVINNLILTWTVFKDPASAQSFSLEDHLAIIFLEAVLNLLRASNYCLNFYLYCLTGTRFRNEFKKMLCAWRTADMTQKQRDKMTSKRVCT